MFPNVRKEFETFCTGEGNLEFNSTLRELLNGLRYKTASSSGGIATKFLKLYQFIPRRHYDLYV